MPTETGSPLTISTITVSIISMILRIATDRNAGLKCKYPRQKLECDRTLECDRNWSVTVYLNAAAASFVVKKGHLYFAWNDLRMAGKKKK